MFFIKLLSLAPFWVIYFVADILYLLNYHIIRYRREVIEKNLSIVFPDMSKAEKLKTIKGFYKNFGDVMLESVKAISISREEMIKRVTYSGIEKLVAAKNHGFSAVYLATHHCNWEWMLLSGTILFPYRVYGVYKPLQNKKFDKLLLDTRSKFGGILVPVDNIVRNIVTNKNEVRGIGLVADQRPHISNKKVWLKTCGHDTAYYTGTEFVPKLENAIVFMSKMVRKKRGYYHIDIIKLAEPPYSKDGNSTEILSKYVTELEKMIKENPSDWLWSHNRWKYSKAEDEIHNRERNELIMSNKSESGLTHSGT